ncbi:hypothetical protein [Cellulomonas soli]
MRRNRLRGGRGHRHHIDAAIGSTDKLAETGQFPPAFGAKARVGSTGGW